MVWWVALPRTGKFPLGICDQVTPFHLAQSSQNVTNITTGPPKVAGFPCAEPGTKIGLAGGKMSNPQLFSPAVIFVDLGTVLDFPS